MLSHGGPHGGHSRNGDGFLYLIFASLWEVLFKMNKIVILWILSRLPPLVLERISCCDDILYDIQFKTNKNMKQCSPNLAALSGKQIPIKSQQSIVFIKMR